MSVRFRKREIGIPARDIWWSYRVERFPSRLGSDRTVVVASALYPMSAQWMPRLRVIDICGGRPHDHQPLGPDLYQATRKNRTTSQISPYVPCTRGTTRISIGEHTLAGSPGCTRVTQGTIVTGFHSLFSLLESRSG